MKEQIQQIIDEAEEKKANMPVPPVTERGIDDSSFNGNLLDDVLTKLKALMVILFILISLSVTAQKKDPAKQKADSILFIKKQMDITKERRTQRNAIFVRDSIIIKKRKH